jgi:hypothetical protein
MRKYRRAAMGLSGRLEFERQQQPRALLEDTSLELPVLKEAGAAKMPSARRPSSYRQYYCAKQGEFAVNRCSEVFLSVFMHPEVVMPMSCSLCEPESRADGELAAQELNQLINSVAEASANAVATARFPDFVQQH